MTTLTTTGGGAFTTDTTSTVPMPVTAGLPFHADVRETHSAVVLLLGDQALKLKKPVDLGFLDFRTREQRLEACRREVELNRRICDDVYLGVSDLHAPDGSLVEHLVTMRRLPDDRRLTALVERADPGLSDQLRAIARRVAVFHASAARSPAITESGGRRALTDRWEANLARLAPYVGSHVEPATAATVKDLAEQFLAGREPLFAARQEGGHVVDGHGDLLADDIFCLDDGPRIIDCLDFDAGLRQVDVVDDLAFLAMDLDRLGAEEAADALVAAYLEYSGDTAPPQLVHHYVAYRATVRSLVTCIRDEQEGRRTREPQVLLELAEHHLRLGQVRLVLVGGPPGTGKSTLAEGLADRLGSALLSTDPLRKELAGVSADTSLAAPFSQGPYTPRHTQAVYDELLRRTELLLDRGESVVLDATWSHVLYRAAAAALARRTSSELSQLHCLLSEDVTRQRVAAREDSVSDADGDIAVRMARHFAAWPGAHLVDAARSPEECLDDALASVTGVRHGRTAFPRPLLPPD